MTYKIFFLGFFVFPFFQIVSNEIQFIVTYPLKTIIGRCSEFEFIGFKIEKEENRYKAQNFQVVCKILSMKTGDPNRDSNMYDALGYPYFSKITANVTSTICAYQNCKIDFELDLHGKKKLYRIEGNFNSNKELQISGEFLVNLLEYDIEPPKLLFLKIDSIVKVKFNFSFPYNIQ
ncbi:MAG: YceI family protein [Leptonema sp. (in: bacteria)]